jgi:Arc/MetJ-type ribon-helix-helix transcriptional regulator
MSSPNDYQLALRIPSELLAAIDEEVERVKQERPGARVQRSDVVREALMRAFFKHPAPSSGPVRRDRSALSNGNGAANGNGNGAANRHGHEHDPADTQ